jgi:hypothetical protein
MQCCGVEKDANYAVDPAMRQLSRDGRALVRRVSRSGHPVPLQGGHVVWPGLTGVWWPARGAFVGRALPAAASGMGRRLAGGKSRRAVPALQKLGWRTAPSDLTGMAGEPCPPREAWLA